MNQICKLLFDPFPSIDVFLSNPSPINALPCQSLFLLPFKFTSFQVPIWILNNADWIIYGGLCSAGGWYGIIYGDLFACFSDISIVPVLVPVIQINLEQRCHWPNHQWWILRLPMVVSAEQVVDGQEWLVLRAAWKGSSSVSSSSSSTSSST